MDLAGTFTVTLDGYTLGTDSDTPETTAQVLVKFQDRKFVLDDDTGKVVFPHKSHRKALPVSLPYNLVLPTDVAAGAGANSTDLGYEVTVLIGQGKHTSTIGTATFAARPADSTADFTDLLSDVPLGPVEDLAGLVAAAEAAAASINRGAANGVAPLDSGSKVPDANLPTRLADATLSATYVSIARALELVPFTDYGNSWAQGGVSSTAGAGYFSRIASRNRTKALVNQGVSGTESGQILDKITTTWTPNTQGLVGLGDIVLNDLRHWGTDTDKATTRETFRAMLARLNSWIVQDSTAASLIYGPGWTNGTSDGTAGRYVDVAWTGPTVNIRVGCVTGSGATVTVKDTGSGATVATFSTGGFKVAFEGVIRLTGYSAGNHTVRVSVDAAATIAGAIVPMPAPPLIAWVKAGDTVEGGATQRARIALYLAECATIAAAYPNVLPVDLNGHGWDMNTMLAPDGLHPNDFGNAFIADRIQEELLELGFTQGLNSMTGTSAGAYAAPTPSYSTSGATAPNARTGVTATNGNQMTVTWTRTGDGGATLTGQPIQASSDGGSTWNTVATAGPTATSYNITSGLTESTSYVIRVGATNSVGTTYSTASAAATAGAVPSTYSADTFNRADNASSMGSTETGSYAWTSENSNQAIVSNTASVTCVDTGLTGCVYMDDTHADGTISATIKTVSVTASWGLLFRAGAGATTGYIFWWNGTIWQLAKRTAQNTYSQVATGTGVPVPVVGDTIKVILNGSSVKCYVNTTLVYTYTDTSYAANTKHGLWHGNGANARVSDDWLHTSITS